MKKALFGAGCFWGVEEFFRKIQGVKNTRVGYSGGHTKNPSYETVCSGTTEHVEVLELNFDETEISYERLLNQIYDHMMEVYDPQRLRLVLDCNPRGGISSRLTIDSDWEVLGGKEEYKEWREDTW